MPDTSTEPTPRPAVEYPRRLGADVSDYFSCDVCGGHAAWVYIAPAVGNRFYIFGHEHCLREWLLNNGELAQ